MEPMNFLKQTALVLACACALPSHVSADEGKELGKDFGAMVQHRLQAKAGKLFGFEKPLQESAAATSGPYRTAAQQAKDQVLVAKPLTAEYLTRQAANHTDMMALYPLQNPTHLITCVEGARETLSSGKLNPSVQRIALDTGAVETVLRGMSRCDGIATTPWNTILATEETNDGAAYEILNPLTSTELSLVARGTNNFVDAGANPVVGQAAYRNALPTMAWEGITVLSSGVVIGGDELRPGTATADADGGSIFKFVPTVAHSGGMIADLNDSPLTAGSVYAMQVSCVNDKQQFGQGCEIGNAAWIAVSAATARSSADAADATGYYRPEDLHRDPMYSDSANPSAVRFCWTNTGNEDSGNYGEVMCAVDNEPLVVLGSDGKPKRTTLVNRFVEGDKDFNSVDNLAFQPGTGNLYVIEDHDNGDIFACLRDGADRDIKSDGCVKMLSVKDSSAEPTGFLFSNDGKTAYVSIQHSDDTNMPLVDGYPTDDIIKITGFKVKSKD